MMCYEKSCRLCLKELNGPGIDFSTISELRETISKLFEVQISRSDTIKCICNKCFEHVMGFRAFKKTITECQLIIKEYQTIKQKVIDTRLITSFKQEVIDVDDPDPVTTNKRKRPAHTAVTDSDINDILAMVHDNSSASSRRLAVSSTSVPKKIKVTQTQEAAIKQEPQSNSPTTVAHRDRSSEPISSTSRDLAEKSTSPSNDKLFNGSIGSSSKDPITPLQTQPVSQQNASQSLASVDTNAEAVSSSVQTPNENRNKSDDQAPTDSNVSITNSASLTEHSELSNTNVTGMNCPKCPHKCRTKKELEMHTQANHATAGPIEKVVPSKIKEIQNSQEDQSISSSEEDKLTSRSRSTRRAKSQAMKKIAVSPSTSPNLRRSTRAAAAKTVETPNNSLTEPRQTSTPIAAGTPTAAPSSSNISKNLNNTARNNTNTSLNKSADKKRIITITLVRTKDSLNFRYCDQYKQSIDFSSVSSDELEDIRKSLMIPEIWTNLKNVFKVSPPDEKTIDELKTIFGDKFNI